MTEQPTSPPDRPIEVAPMPRAATERAAEGVVPATDRERDGALAAASVLTAALVVLAWANSVAGEPVLDDWFLVTRETCYRSLSGLLRILEFEPFYPCGYRPARFVSYAVDWLLFGEWFPGYHIGNIVRHVLAALAAGLLAAELFRSASGGAAPRGEFGDEGPRRGERSARWAAWTVASLWALHPVQTDAVSYVSGRRDVILGLWFFWSLWLALRVERRGGWRWALPLCAMGVAVLAKESAVVIPALYLAWRTRETRVTELWRRHRGPVLFLAFAASMSVGMFLWRGVLHSHSQRGFAWWGGSIASNFATVFALQPRYLGHLAGALPLVGDYGPETIPIAAGFGEPRVLAGICVVIAVVSGATLLRRRRPVASFGLVFYAVSLLPMCHIIPHHELFAEHYLYVPLFGALVFLVDIARWPLEQAERGARLRNVVRLVLGLLLATFGIRVADRNRDWASEATFFENVYAQAPRNWRARYNLGNIRYEQERWGEALDLWAPLWAQWQPGTPREADTLRRCIVAGGSSGRLPEAIACAEQLRDHHPDLPAGPRALAEMRLMRGEVVSAFEAAMEWWRRDGSEEGLEFAARTAALGAEVPAESVRGALLEAARSVEGPSERLVVYVALALEGRGERDRAWEWVSAPVPRARGAEEAGAICRLGEALGRQPPEGVRCGAAPEEDAAGGGATAPQ